MIKGVTRERIRMPQVRSVTTLMYHSIRDERGRMDPGADDTYTVSGDQFAEHLERIGDARLPVSTISDLAGIDPAPAGRAGGMNAAGPGPLSGNAVVLTFDDGTASHLDSVLHMLWERNMPGEFFVYPVNVGRAGFLSWSELRGMASAGMSIQSHGYSPRYLNDLDDTAIVNELLRSKRVIEDRIGQAVTVFAAAGGRINPFIAALARRVGYKAVCGSRPGRWQRHSAKPVIPRIPVRASTTADEIGDWISNRTLALTAQAGRYRMLQAARWALGNDVYDHLRRRYLGGH